MSSRRKLTPTARARIFLDAGGRCHLCSRKIAEGELWEAEHVQPLSMGGSDTPANMRPAHVDCHAGKTKAEAGPRAKADRNAKRAAGIKRPSRMAGSRGSPYRKRMDGTVERRDA